MAFARWDPFRDLLALHDQIGQLAGDLGGWTPAVDLYENHEAFVLTAELPGVSRDQIHIQAEDHRIIIRGERSHEHEASCEQYHRVERGHGRFARAFVLPEPIDVGGVTADLRDGLLQVTIPKRAGHSPNRVDIS